MKRLQRHRVKARTRLQYEAAECGAASLGTILAYFGRVVELGELRLACGVNRDGSNAKQVLVAGREYGLQARAYRCSGDQLKSEGQFPCIVFWGFNHFLVVEGFDASHAFLSDPAQGRVRVEMEEFLDNFTGIVLEFEPGPEFQTGGHERSPLLSLPATLAPYRHSIALLLLVSSAQAVLTLLVAGFTSTFIDSFLQNQRFYFGIPLIWLLLITLLAWLALLAGQFLVLRRMELLLSKRLTADLFRKLFQVTFAFYQARFSGRDCQPHAPGDGDHPGGGGADAPLRAVALDWPVCSDFRFGDLSLAGASRVGGDGRQSGSELVAHRSTL